MKHSKYVYYVECKVASNSWLSKFFITCDDVDKILPMLNDSGLDNLTAYGEPKEPVILIHQIQRFAKCKGDGHPDGIIEMHRMYCDIKPNDLF